MGSGNKCFENKSGLAAEITELTSDDLDQALTIRKIEFDHSSPDENFHTVLSTATHRHDHGKIAGQGHFLVLVSRIYNPAFYFTPDELQNRSQDATLYTL